MEINQTICCRELRKSTVFDKDGKKVGHIGDLAFKFDGDLRLTKFILAGPIFEEVLEKLKIRKDKDPVFDASMIEKLGDKVQINTATDSLKTTLDTDSISSDEIRLSKLEKLSIIDKHGKVVGNAVDIDFDVDGSASLIVGGGFFEEKLEAIGIKKDIDLLVPGKVIESISDSIKLTVDKEELSLTMEEELEKKEEVEAKRDIIVHRDISRVRLFSQRPL